LGFLLYLIINNLRKCYIRVRILFSNCDSNHNVDTYSNNGEPYGGSDGFESANATSTNNVLSVCRFWRNSDDSLDLQMEVDLMVITILEQ
jgi:hypothetical protein